MASLKRDENSDEALCCQGCTTPCCIIIPTHTHTHTHHRMQTRTYGTHSGRQQLRLGKAAGAEAANEAEGEQKGRTRMQNEPVRRPQRRVGLREDPKRSPAGAAGGECRTMRVPPPSILPLRYSVSQGGIWGRRQAVWS